MDGVSWMNVLDRSTACTRELRGTEKSKEREWQRYEQQEACL